MPADCAATSRRQHPSAVHQVKRIRCCISQLGCLDLCEYFRLLPSAAWCSSKFQRAKTFLGQTHTRALTVSIGLWIFCLCHQVCASGNQDAVHTWTNWLLQPVIHKWHNLTFKKVGLFYAFSLTVRNQVSFRPTFNCYPWCDPFN